MSEHCAHRFEVKPARGSKYVSCAICYRVLGADEMLRGYVAADSLTTQLNAAREALRKASDSMCNIKHCVDLALFNLTSLVPPDLERAAHYLRLPSDEWPTTAAIEAALAGEGGG